MNKNNRIGVDDSEAVNSNTTQLRILSEQFPKRKLLWIIFSILVGVLIMTIPTIIFKVKKPNVENTSTIDITTTKIKTVETAITITITSKPLAAEILTTETIKTTTQTEQLLHPIVISRNTKWKQNATTVAGGNGRGDELNQLHFPRSIYIDDDDHQSIYISDFTNDRIVKWKFGAKNGEIVAGGNFKGNDMNQLNEPLDAILDKKNNSIIICDSGNYRVIKWYRGYDTNQQIMMSHIVCAALTMDNNGDLYVTVDNADEVRLYKQGETTGITVAGNNRHGNGLHQFNHPSFTFLDQNYSLYVADTTNGRAMKWVKNAKEGIVVARGHRDKINTALIEGVIVDHEGNIYVSDSIVCQIMRWPPGAKNGSTVVGKSGCGGGNNQLRFPIDLSFDRYGNLYVVDHPNHRVQKFAIDLD